MSLVGHGSLPKHLGSAEHSCIYFIYEQGRGQQKVRCLRLVPRSEVLPWIQSVRRCFDDLGRCSASWWMCLGTATYRGTNMGELNAEATSKRSKPEVSLYPGDLVFFEFLLSASLNIPCRSDFLGFGLNGISSHEPVAVVYSSRPLHPSFFTRLDIAVKQPPMHCTRDQHRCTRLT